MIQHLRKHHGDADAGAFKKRLAEERSKLVARNPGRSHETRIGSSGIPETLQEKFDAALVNLAVKTTVPLSLFKQEAFRDMLNVLNFESRGLMLIDRRTLGRRIDSAHNHSEDFRCDV